MFLLYTNERAAFWEQAARCDHNFILLISSRGKSTRSFRSVRTSLDDSLAVGTDAELVPKYSAASETDSKFSKRMICFNLENLSRMGQDVDEVT